MGNALGVKAQDIKLETAQRNRALDPETEDHLKEEIPTAEEEDLLPAVDPIVLDPILEITENPAEEVTKRDQAAAVNQVAKAEIDLEKIIKTLQDLRVFIKRVTIRKNLVKAIVLMIEYNHYIYKRVNNIYKLSTKLK